MFRDLCGERILIITKCGSPLGVWEIHCDKEQMLKIKAMFAAEMDNTRTDANRSIDQTDN